ncbi:MAG: hypothetical protein U0838_14770 [Chloroflexota bacterium]
MAAIDIDSSRLAHLAEVAGPVVANDVEASFNSRGTPPRSAGRAMSGSWSTAPALVVQAVAMAAPGARLNLFAGFAVGTRAPLDLNAVIGGGLYLFGTSGSRSRHAGGPGAARGRAPRHQRLARRGQRHGGRP